MSLSLLMNVLTVLSIFAVIGVGVLIVLIFVKVRKIAEKE